MLFKQGVVGVEVAYAGDGWSGEYDSSDPVDEKMLRFTVRRIDGDGGWEDIESRITVIPASIGEEKMLRLAILIMAGVYDKVVARIPIGSTCSRMAWICPNSL